MIPKNVLNMIDSGMQEYLAVQGLTGHLMAQIFLVALGTYSIHSLVTTPGVGPMSHGEGKTFSSE